jgi:predicted nuclease of predicted toxin-antitoxin system
MFRIRFAHASTDMRILLDECVPWPLHKLLVGHSCTSVQKRGWGGKKNGELLSLAEKDFDLLITSDQNIRYQQNLTGRRIGILALSTNDLRRIFAASTLIQATIATFQPGEFRHLEIPE